MGIRINYGGNNKKAKRSKGKRIDGKVNVKKRRGKKRTHRKEMCQVDKNIKSAK